MNSLWAALALSAGLLYFLICLLFYCRFKKLDKEHGVLEEQRNTASNADSSKLRK